MPRSVPGPCVVLLVAFSLLPSFLGAATFTVINTNDSGPGSLRQAILNANANPGADVIAFSIGSGSKTIAPTSALPTATDPVTIDATTQPGFAGNPIIELSGANAGPGTDGLTITGGNSSIRALVINRFQAQFLVGGGNGIVLQTGGGNVITGNYIGTNVAGTAALGNGGDGILISSSGSNTIGGELVLRKGNLISGNANGIRIVGTGSDGNAILGNAIGADATGNASIPNFSNGVAVLAGSANAVGAPFQLNVHVRNTISGNLKDGIVVTGSAVGTQVVNNTVGSPGNGTNGIEVAGASNTTIAENSAVANGTNGVLIVSGATGTIVRGNLAQGNAFNGVIVSGANGNTIGGTTLADSNTITGNGTNGVRVRTGATGNVVLGNFIGTDISGTSGLGNTLEGVQLNDGAAGNVVGGSTAGEANVICGNSSNGVLITDATTVNNAVKGNRIGITSTGLPLANAKRGVSIESGAAGNAIGGTAVGEGNTIASNTTAGVFVESGTGNAIRGNAIYANVALGIDLAPAGVTANDPCDADTGPNNLQNFPVLSSATSAGAMTNVLGSLNSTATTTFHVDFFANTACDSSGNGEGQFFLGSSDVMTDAGCLALIDATLPVPAPGAWITATATDPAGNTSEFSACVLLPGPALSSIAPTSGPAGGGTTLNLTGVRFQNGATVTVGGAAAGSPIVSDDMHATAVSPALAPGALYDVVLTNLDGLSATLPKAWLADFSDVSGTHPFHGFVEKIFRHGVTAGCTPGHFCPADPVTRAQVAVFLLRAHDGPGYTPPPATGTVFADVPSGSFAAAWIEQLAARSITAGCGGGNYCPQSPVTREQMAVFLLRTEHGPSYVPPDATGIFADVPVSSPYARWIERLAAEGITGGCGGGNFCPQNATTRGQMAVFLVTAFGLM